MEPVDVFPTNSDLVDIFWEETLWSLSLTIGDNLGYGAHAYISVVYLCLPMLLGETIGSPCRYPRLVAI